MKEPFDFGETLRFLRTQKKMTQKHLAKLLGLSETAISKYESNQASPPLDTARHIAAVFNVPMDKLCGTESRDNLSLYGLSDKQSDIMRDLAELFRNQNGSIKGKFSDEQHKMLGRITESFFEK